MIKNTFTITASADGTIVLSETPVFNKLESGVTKLLFTLPNMTGYAYLLARHDRKEWYAIPIDSENKIMMGQTVTRLHGRWAFNVCISSNLITDDPQTENIVYMSDVFEGLVYDNVSDDHQPSALEPNVLKIVNNAQNIYEQFVSKFDEVEDDLIQAANNLTLAQTAANSATSNAAAASTSATNAAASATTALGYKTAAESAKDAAVVAQTSAQTWSGKAYEHLVAAREAQADAEDARDDAETYKDAAEAAAEAAARSAGANSIDYDGTNHKLTISVAGSDLDSAVIATDSALDNASTAYVENKTITHEVDYSNYNNSNVYNYDAVSESLTETTFSSGISSSGTSTTSIIKAIAQVVKEINNVVKQIANALKLYAKKDSLANVATSGSYNDLSDVPETTAVSVTAIETSGTHIADIEVDGTTTEIYAPEGGSDVEIVTEWETTTSDEKVPSEKLVKTSLESLNDDLVELDNSILTHNISVNRFVLPNYESGKVIDLDGSINTSSTKGRCTDYIEVDSSVPYSVYCFDSAWNNGYNCIWSVVEYDSDKNRIAGTQIAKASYTLQSNTKYIRVSNFDATNGGIRWVNGLVVCKTSELPNSYVKGFEDWSYIDDTKIMSDVDNKQITLWGDSLTMGNTDTSIISNASNMIVNRCGGGSESSTALAVRMGAIDCNVLPFNIGQNVDAIEISIKTYGIRGGVNVGGLMGVNVGGINPVYINGIKGNLSRSDNKIYFTRETSGEYIQITRPTKLFTNSEMTRLNDIAVIWIGTNDGVNTNNLQYTTDLIFDMIDSLKAKEKKYIVMGLHQCITQSQIESINNRFSELFGKHFLNYYDYLMNYGLADQDKTATSQDEQDIADKRIPTSLRSDFTHFTTATYTYSINPLIVKKLKDLGYIN